MKYESHLTIDSEQVDLGKFKRDCDEMGVKPLLIALQEHTKLAHVMTACTRDLVDDREALDWAGEQVIELNARGYKVIRLKVEAEPTHPMAPKMPGQEMPEGCYFETHIKVTLADPTVEASLREFAKDNDVHFSRNAFKLQMSGHPVFMMTYRSHDKCLSEFKEYVDRFILELMNQKSDRIFLDEKIITEFALFDTNVAHDNEWLAV